MEDKFKIYTIQTDEIGYTGIFIQALKTLEELEPGESMTILCRETTLDEFKKLKEG